MGHRGRPPNRGRDADLALVLEGLDELRKEISGLRQEVRQLRALAPDSKASRCLTIDETCAAYRVSKATFERWKEDARTGLRGVLLQPGGPGTRVLVPVAAFERWLTERGTAVAKE